MTTAVVNAPLPLSLSSLEVRSFRGGVKVIDQIAEEWRQLCEEAVDHQPFYRPEWFRAHVGAFLPRAKLLLIVVRREGRLCLVLPLVEERGTYSKVPIRKLRAPVNVHGGRYDATRIRGIDGERAIAAAWDYLAQLDTWDVLQICNAPAESSVARVVSTARAAGFRVLVVADRPSPYVRVPADPVLLQGMPANSKLRSQLRRARARLLEQGELKFYRVETADRFQLERFYQLEASGWKGKAGSAILCNGSRPFYDEIARAAARHGYFSLFMLELRGRLLAGHFAFVQNGCCFSPIVAYDEAFKQYAPGHLMVAEILRDCCERGIQSYDITGQDQSWKMKWTSVCCAINNYFVFRGPLGRLAYGIRSGLKSAVGLLHKGSPSS
jgi:CelD/BcsL family acetyltransferase involved in cellulose biosynthesis